jgi:SAM-dependent methyltransferase
VHDESFNELRRCVDKYLDRKKALTIVDVGSMDVNGCYRPLFDSPAWRYIGLDVGAGKNVDIVLEDPYRFPLKFHSADVVISGQAFEHIEFFWLTWMEMVRVLRPGGLAILVLPQNIAEHRYPVDCWRFLPDSMNAFARHGGLTVEEVRNYSYVLDPTAEWLKFYDNIGVFRKPQLGAAGTAKEIVATLARRFLFVR